MALSDALERLEKIEQDRSIRERQLLDSIKSRLPEIRQLLEEVGGEWQAEDHFYRFYHQSFKVYGLQSHTTRIVDLLRSLAPDRPLNPWFEQIITQGTGITFEQEHNQRWLAETRPILEAFFHARMMLELEEKYGHALVEPTQPMPSGWAAVLYLYGLR